ncbi:MAG TPA: hypothetical protein DCM87_06425 [Planctomycetes bacterium]|nr:hypothetical protein [Planctomycetota bacterium]
MKLNVKAFALAWAVLWGLCLFLIPWVTMAATGYTGETVLGRLYRGYTISPLGSLVGLCWGLEDGLVSGLLVAWLYNRFLPGRGGESGPAP